MSKLKNIKYYFPNEKLADIFMAVGLLEPEEVGLIIKKFGAHLLEDNLVSGDCERKIEILLSNKIPPNLQKYKRFKIGLKEFFYVQSEYLVNAKLAFLSSDKKAKVFVLFDQDTLRYKPNSNIKPNEELEIFKLLDDVRLKSLKKLSLDEQARKNKSKKTFYDLIKKHIEDEDEMYAIFRILPKEEKLVITSIFGKNLKTFDESKYAEQEKSLQDIIHKRFTTKPQHLKHKRTFYDRLKRYVRNVAEIPSIYRLLPEEYKEIVGIGFDSSYKDTTYSYAAYETKIAIIMKDYFEVLLENSRSRYSYVIKPLLILFPQSGIEKINEILNGISDLEIIKLSRYFKFEKSVSDDIISDVETNIIPKIAGNLQVKTEKEEPEKDPEFLTDLLRLMRLFYKYNPKPKQKEMEEFLIFALKIDETGKYSQVDICSFFNINFLEADEITKRVLTIYHNQFGEMYTEIIAILYRNRKNKPVKLEIERIKVGSKDE